MKTKYVKSCLIALSIVACLFQANLFAQDAAMITNSQFADILVTYVGADLPAGSDNLPEKEYYEVQSNVLAERKISEFIEKNPNDPVTRGTLSNVIYNIVEDSPSFYPAKTMRVVTVSGDVKVFFPGKKEPMTCREAMGIEVGTRVVTGYNSYVDISLDVARKNVVKVKENSEVVIRIDDEGDIELIDGEIITKIGFLKKGHKFVVKTPVATCGARGTGWSTKTNSTNSNVSVFDGTVAVKGINEDGSPMRNKQLVKNGFESSVDQFNEPGKPKRIKGEILLKISSEIGVSPISGAALTQAKVGVLSAAGFIGGGNAGDSMSNGEVVDALNNPVLAQAAAEGYSEPEGGDQGGKDPMSGNEPQGEVFRAEKRTSSI